MKSEFDKWHDRLMGEQRKLESEKQKEWQSKLAKAKPGLDHFHKQFGLAVDKMEANGADPLFVRHARRIHRIMGKGVEKVGQIAKMIAKTTGLAEKIRGRHAYPIEGKAGARGRQADLALADALDRYAVSSKVIFDMQASGTRWTPDSVDPNWFKNPYKEGNEGSRRTAMFFRDLDKHQGRYVGVNLKEYHNHRHTMWQLQNKPDAMKMGFDVESLEGRLKNKKPEAEPAQDFTRLANVKFIP